MDFILNEEQAILKGSVARFSADLRAAMDKKAVTAADRWGRYADMGLLGLPFDEDFGGFGGGGVETMIVAEEMGRHLLTDPYIPVVAVAGRLLADHCSEEQKAYLLPRVADGSLIVVPAFGEPKSRYSLSRVATTAVPSKDGFVLDGRKAVVLSGAEADLLLVTARLSGEAGDEDGIGVFLVSGDLPGVTRRPVLTVDGREAAEIVLDGVRVDKTATLGSLGQGGAIARRAEEFGVAALAGEAVGAMSAVFDMTVEYLQTRRQFGVPIGKFQALQHRVVDMRVALELARSIAAGAAIAADLDNAQERRRIISAAKVQVCRSGRYIGQQAIQLHGAMGMTDEYGAGRYFKRLLVLSSLYGDADHHLERFVSASQYGEDGALVA
ncbi:acyl-CoA dehydrogenase family protein [Magnetospirillum sp. 15-1]|uniref:acyl-CoA dehydrogenase family protein n=1 Tax=Magnetospirillum sp. 15-1 TaxID=1979370 RepID=UPI000BBB8DDF|nr:acyl-CoA dehydrogenase family protein [Magnetospirillum sp. 15-1]